MLKWICTTVTQMPEAFEALLGRPGVQPAVLVGMLALGLAGSTVIPALFSFLLILCVWRRLEQALHRRMSLLRQKSAIEVIKTEAMRNRDDVANELFIAEARLEQVEQVHSILSKELIKVKDDCCHIELDHPDDERPAEEASWPPTHLRSRCALACAENRQLRTKFDAVLLCMAWAVHGAEQAPLTVSAAPSQTATKQAETASSRSPGGVGDCDDPVPHHNEDSAASRSEIPIDAAAPQDTTAGSSSLARPQRRSGEGDDSARACASDDAGVLAMLLQAEGKDGVPVFQQPDDGGTLVALIPSGQTARSFGQQGAFIRVRWHDIEGWVASKDAATLQEISLDSRDVVEDVLPRRPLGSDRRGAQAGPLIENDQVVQQCALTPGVNIDASVAIASVLEGVHDAVEEGLGRLKGTVANFRSYTRY